MSYLVKQLSVIQCIFCSLGKQEDEVTSTRLPLYWIGLLNTAGMFVTIICFFKTKFSLSKRKTLRSTRTDF